MPGARRRHGDEIPRQRDYRLTAYPEVIRYCEAHAGTDAGRVGVHSTDGTTASPTWVTLGDVALDGGGTQTFAESMELFCGTVLAVDGSMTRRVERAQGGNGPLRQAARDALCHYARSRF